MALIIGLAWAWSRDRMDPTNWSVPLTYAGDSLLQLLEIKASEEGDFSLFGPLHVSRLGAPYIANWNDYPMQDRLVRTFIQWMAIAFGTFPASNLAMLLAHVTAGLSFYLCCRLLRYRWEWAFVAGVLFGLSYFQFWRGIHHMLLSWTYTLPMGLVSVWLIGGAKRLSFGNRWGGMVLLSSMLIGFGNPYYIGMYLQLVVFALIYQWFGDRRRRNLMVGLAAIGLTIGTFLLMNVGVFAYKAEHGGNPGAVVRNYYQAEQFALKPMDLLMPPAEHRLGLLAEVGRSFASTNKLEGELFSPYLGFVALAALMWMGWEFVLGLLRKHRRCIPTHALQSWWVLVYAVVGGLNTAMALAGMQLLRASNRMSLYLFALALFFGVSRLSRLSRDWSNQKVWKLAAALLLLGILDQVPRRIPDQQTESVRAQLQMDQDLFHSVELATGLEGAFFQLPVIGFPETRPPHQMTDYEHLRPYLVTTGIRLTFGSDKGRPEENWQESLSRGAPRNMVETLEDMGFRGIILNRRGYPDGGETVLRSLSALGRNVVASGGDGALLVVALQPRDVVGFPSDYPVVDAGISMGEVGASGPVNRIGESIG